MSRTFPMGRVGGVPLRVGPSWIVVVPLVGIALFAGIEPRLGGFRWRLLVAVCGTLVMFASVVIHELGHVVAAMRRGITVDRIVVYLFGGYTDMDLDAAAPHDDASVSMAGPVASGLLALGILVIALLAPEWAGIRRTLAVLGLVNLGVAVFNLLPGYPLDGGRIVRAGLITSGVDAGRAEIITSRIGIGLGALSITAGIVLSILGEPASVVLSAVGGVLVVIALAAHPARSVSPLGAE